MGVFHALPEDGSSKTAETLAKELDADKELISECSFCQGHTINSTFSNRVQYV
jgi:hypothetical protein